MRPVLADDTPVLLYQLSTAVTWIDETMVDLRNLQADVNKSVVNALEPIYRNWDKLTTDLKEISEHLIQRCKKTQDEMVGLQENFIRVKSLQSASI